MNKEQNPFSYLQNNKLSPQALNPWPYNYGSFNHPTYLSGNKDAMDAFYEHMLVREVFGSARIMCGDGGAGNFQAGLFGGW